MKVIKYFLHKIKYNIFLKDFLKIMRNRKKSKNYISILKFEIFDIEYNFEKYLSNRIFKNLPIDFSMFFKQYNFLRLIRPEKMNFYILKTKKFYYPLTKEQIIFLKRRGYDVNSFISNLLFFFYSIKELCVGFAFFFIINLSFIFNLTKFKKKINNELFIHNLSQNQINSFNKTTNNLQTWIKEKFNLHNHTLVHNNKFCKKKFRYNKLFLPDLNRLSEILKFNYYFFKYFLFVLIDLLFFRIKQISIFSEIVKYCCAISKNKDYYQGSFFFFGEQAFFRPLFTYSIGKNVFYIEYQFNIKSIYLKDGLKEKRIDWKNLTWSNYVLWNNAHKKFIEKNQIIQAKYYILGRISFGTLNFSEIDSKFKRSILIFDVIPYRRSFIASYNIYAESFHEEKILKFLGDIYKLSDEYSLYIKPKRKQFLNIFSKKYNNFLKKNSKFNILNPEYSPEDVIKKFDKIICFPFSSTAWIAKEMNKKVCYYDVAGIHEDFGETVNGIKIIRNFSDLRRWSQC